ncbi:hypothetical protein NQ318_009224, partial [Aromia moschata]
MTMTILTGLARGRRVFFRWPRLGQKNDKSSFPRLFEILKNINFGQFYNVFYATTFFDAFLYLESTFQDAHNSETFEMATLKLYIRRVKKGNRVENVIKLALIHNFQNLVKSRKLEEIYDFSSPT